MGVLFDSGAYAQRMRGREQVRRIIRSAEEVPRLRLAPEPPKLQSHPGKLPAPPSPTATATPPFQPSRQGVSGQLQEERRRIFQ